MKAKLMHTPWGPPQDVEALADVVLRIETASHGGLKLSRERAVGLPSRRRPNLTDDTDIR